MNSMFTISVHYTDVNNDGLITVFQVLFTHPGLGWGGEDFSYTKSSSQIFPKMYY